MHMDAIRFQCFVRWLFQLFYIAKRKNNFFTNGENGCTNRSVKMTVMPSGGGGGAKGRWHLSN